MVNFDQGLAITSLMDKGLIENIASESIQN